MSHFIKTENDVKPPSLLLGEIYQIKAPNRRKLSKNFAFERFSTNQTTKTIDRIVHRESIRGLELNEKKLRQSMVALKKRIKLFGMTPQAHIPFQTGTSKTEHKGGKLSFSPTKSVDIKKKYSSQLAIKLNAMKQTEQIVQYRDQMERWRNSHYNSITKSPNFCKMNYLIWRVRDCDKENDLFGKTNTTAQHQPGSSETKRSCFKQKTFSSQALTSKRSPDGILKVYKTNYTGFLSSSNKKKQITQP